MKKISENKLNFVKTIVNSKGKIGHWPIKNNAKSYSHLTETPTYKMCISNSSLFVIHWINRYFLSKIPSGSTNSSELWKNFIMTRTAPSRICDLHYISGVWILYDICYRIAEPEFVWSFLIPPSLFRKRN